MEGAPSRFLASECHHDPRSHFFTEKCPFFRSALRPARSFFPAAQRQRKFRLFGRNSRVLPLFEHLKLLPNGRNNVDTHRAAEATRAQGGVGMKLPVYQHHRRHVLCALLAVKNSPNRHATDGRLACHGRQGGGAVGVLTNLAQDASV